MRSEYRIPGFGLKPLIGVVHLPPLPGSIIGYSGIDRVIEYSVAEAKKLEEAGFDAVILENYSDNPYSVRVNDLVLSSITVIAREVIRETGLKVGISLLRNAGLQGLAAAYAAGAHFVRINAYCEVRVSGEGLLMPISHELEKLRQRLDRHVAVFADVDVKHSSPLGERPLSDVVHDCVSRGRMDAIIVTSRATSEAPSPGYVAAIRQLAKTKPIIIGSGITAENIKAYWNLADGFIVGTYIKHGGSTKMPIDPQRAAKLASVVRELRITAKIAN
ncbi:BtpA/SgcQ family protein [Pyrofollis japonicus]|uniref:BtpA/SgcQ family protein n=1 Tax=Pyrofollis japonicus TaxID=3060460 RepID=UPI00295AA29F|nr:BtpA/SgcQ family protein [Pyrofollis japonicus]BEP17700.1 BtpA/SgcQ family protein [Pyrofollis japonicus]